MCLHNIWMTLSNVPNFTGVNGHCALFSRLLLDGRLEPSEKILYGNCHRFQSWRSCWGKTAANGQNKITNPNGPQADPSGLPANPQLTIPIVWKLPLVSILKKLLMVKIKWPTAENMFKNRDILLKQSFHKRRLLRGGGRGVINSEKWADVVYGWPLRSPDNSKIS